MGLQLASNIILNVLSFANNFIVVQKNEDGVQKIKFQFSSYM